MECPPSTPIIDAIAPRAAASSTWSAVRAWVSAFGCAAIIARKRQLMESVVHEDDQGTLEVLDREELAALMSFDLDAATVAGRD